MEEVMWKLKKMLLLLRCRIGKLRWAFYRKGFDFAWNVYWKYDTAREYLISRGITGIEMMHTLRNCNKMFFKYAKLERQILEL
jgi:hypothetical protein